MASQDIPAKPGVFIPPPPVGPPGRRAAAQAAAPALSPARPAPATPSRKPPPVARRGVKRIERPVGYRFEAVMNAAEVDERNRPGAAWSAKAVRLSRSNLVFTARRMCYIESRLFIAVHLIDAAPAPLFGVVHNCEYEGDGLYRVDLELGEPPESVALDEWLHAQTPPALRPHAGRRSARA